jgi:hypothetical protein
MIIRSISLFWQNCRLEFKADMGTVWVEGSVTTRANGSGRTVQGVRGIFLRAGRYGEYGEFFSSGWAGLRSTWFPVSYRNVRQKPVVTLVEEFFCTSGKISKTRGVFYKRNFATVAKQKSLPSGLRPEVFYPEGV